MEKYNRDKVAERIKELRESKSWNQVEMGEELNKILGYRDKTPGEDGLFLGVLDLSGDKGKQYVNSHEALKVSGRTIKNLDEKKRNISVNVAFAYAHIFNVSVDYVLGYSDDPHPGNEYIRKEIGLSDAAIKVLKDLTLEASAQTVLVWLSEEEYMGIGAEDRVSFEGEPYRIGCLHYEKPRFLLKVISRLIADARLEEMLMEINGYLCAANSEPADEIALYEFFRSMNSDDRNFVENKLLDYGYEIIKSKDFADRWLDKAVDCFKEIIKDIDVRYNSESKHQDVIKEARKKYEVFVDEHGNYATYDEIAEAESLYNYSFSNDKNIWLHNYFVENPEIAKKFEEKMERSNRDIYT